MIRKNKTLKISNIVVDERIYPRHRLNESIVREYAKKMDAGKIFPNIEIAYFKKKYIIVDGWHRLEAQKFRSEEFILTDIKDNYTDISEIIVASFRANEKHGLRLSELDKIKTAKVLINMDFDIEQITELTGITINSVKKKVIPEFKRQILTDKMKKGKFPNVVKEKVKKEERRGDIDNKEAERYLKKHEIDIWIEELNRFYIFLKNEKFDIENKQICNCIGKIKRILKKRFPKL